MNGRRGYNGPRSEQREAKGNFVVVVVVVVVLSSFRPSFPLDSSQLTGDKSASVRPPARSTISDSRCSLMRKVNEDVFSLASSNKARPKGTTHAYNLIRLSTDGALAVVCPQFSSLSRLDLFKAATTYTFIHFFYSDISAIHLRFNRMNAKRNDINRRSCTCRSVPDGMLIFIDWRCYVDAAGMKCVSTFIGSEGRECEEEVEVAVSIEGRGQRGLNLAENVVLPLEVKGQKASKSGLRK